MTASEYTDDVSEGGVAYFTAIITDTAGNATRGTQSASTLYRDDVSASPFTVGTVTAVGGRVVTNYYNNTNTNLTVTVPIDNDPTLENGTIQIVVSVDSTGGYPSNSYVNINDAITITSTDINTNKVITITDQEFIGNVNEGEIASFNAIIYDGDGNDGTTGTASSNIITRDETSPLIPNVTFTKGSTKQFYNNKIIVKFANDVSKWDYSVNFGKSFITKYGNSSTILQLNDGVYMPGSIIIRNYDNAGNRSIVINSGKIIIATSRHGFPLSNNSASMNITKKKGYAFSRAAF